MCWETNAQGDKHTDSADSHTSQYSVADKCRDGKLPVFCRFTWHMLTAKLSRAHSIASVIEGGCDRPTLSACSYTINYIRTNRHFQFLLNNCSLIVLQKGLDPRKITSSNNSMTFLLPNQGWLAPPLWPAGHSKKFVSRMIKYAVFHIKPTYNH